MSTARNRPAPRMHGRGGMMQVEKAKDFKGSLRKLLKYLRPYTPQLVIIILFASASNVFTIIGPKVLGNATTTLAQSL
ncbi:MAG: ABC transporter ATP-binding protein, partial [Solobacterium sp.]|nr:ABC transporter ATP-binding protein [Solobacterium sp.]